MKELRLTNGEYTIVDDDDIKYLDQFIWRADHKRRNIYAVRTLIINGKYKEIRLHDILIDNPQKLVVIHINGNTLDNRKTNLILGTLSDYYKIFPKISPYKLRHTLEERVQKNKEMMRKANMKYKSSGLRSIYYKNRRKNDIGFRLANLLRQRLWVELKRNKGIRSRSAIKLVGCSINDLKIHLENQFKDGMSWDNHGIDGWHIDHIIPCAKFDLSDIEQQKICFHYTNLQPLWAKENMIKRDKWPYL